MTDYEMDEVDEDVRAAEEARTRPLFEEPSWEHEREDEWSFPKGFLLGGMGLPERLQLGQQYFDAANVLVETIMRNDFADYRLANPVLYLYRHSLELTLKGLIGSDADKHDLQKLANSFEAVVRREFNRKVRPWVIQRIKEIAAIDPQSTAFRYAETYNQASKKREPVPGEIYVDVRHLQAAMGALNQALLSILDVSYRSVALN